MVSDRSRAGSSVKRRKNGVKTEGGLKFKKVLSSVEGRGGVEVGTKVLGRLHDRGLGSEKLLHALAFSMNAGNQAVDRDAKGEGRGRRAPASAKKPVQRLAGSEHLDV